MATINVIKRKGDSILAKRNKYGFDYWLVLAASALLVIGFLMVYSTTFDKGFLWKGDSTYYLVRQGIFMLLGIVGIFVVLQFDYQFFRRGSIPLLLITISLLLFLLIFGELDEYGAKRTLFGGSVQPAEIAKLVTILYIADWMDSKGDRIKNLNYGLFPFSIIIGVVAALIVAQPSLSTATLIVLINFTLFFVGGADLKQVAIVVVSGMIVFILATLFLSHASLRVENFIASINDPSQAHVQVQSTRSALANGGWFGVGLGQGTQKYGPLPLPHTDTIFATLGEEMGLLGTIGVVGLFGFMAWRGFVIASRARDTYGFLLAVGITVWFSYQAMFNIAVTTGLAPVTGMPLPFLTYGGSSMVMVLLGVGILLNISRDSAGGRRASRRQPVVS